MKRLLLWLIMLPQSPEAYFTPRTLRAPGKAP